jgi:replicative DNA helicase
MFGKQFLSAVVEQKATMDLIAYGDIDHLFRASEKGVFRFVKDFVRDFGTVPTHETIETHTGEKLPSVKEPHSYYMALMRDRHIELVVKEALKSANNHLHPEHKDPVKALETITNAVMRLQLQHQGKQVTDFRFSLDMIHADWKAKWVSPTGLRCGWPTLDENSGGLNKGDLLSFVGRPAAGKTWQMLYAAHHGWDLAGKAELLAKKKGIECTVPPQSRMFVSMEMSPVAITQRLAAMQSHQDAFKVKNAALPKHYKQKLMDSLLEIQSYPAPFYVVDGNLAATVEDIYTLARQLHPDAIFIDGAYLVRHPHERDRFRRVAENCDLIKRELTALAPVTASWQFAKTASQKQKKKGDKADLDDIGYTDAIAQISSIVVGIFEEESIETLKCRVNEIMKGRSGETGMFRTNWNFQAMDFQEIEAVDLSELQY